MYSHDNDNEIKIVHLSRMQINIEVGNCHAKLTRSVDRILLSCRAWRASKGNTYVQCYYMR